MKKSNSHPLQDDNGKQIGTLIINNLEGRVLFLDKEKKVVEEFERTERGSWVSYRRAGEYSFPWQAAQAVSAVLSQFQLNQQIFDTYLKQCGLKIEFYEGAAPKRNGRSTSHAHHV